MVEAVANRLLNRVKCCYCNCIIPENEAVKLADWYFTCQDRQECLRKRKGSAGTK